MIRWGMAEGAMHVPRCIVEVAVGIEDMGREGTDVVVDIEPHFLEKFAHRVKIVTRMIKN